MSLSVKSSTVGVMVFTPHPPHPQRIASKDLPLARNPLNRNSEARNEDGFYESVLADRSTRVLVLDRNLAPLREDRLVTVPIEALELKADARTLYLAKAEDTAEHYVLALREDLENLPAELMADNITWHTLREAARTLPETDAALLVESTAALHWLTNHGFCPVCGAPADLTHSGWVRVCRAEGRELYPRTDPAIIVSVIDQDDRILLGTSATWKRHHFSVLAGFVEPGESLESAVIREVAEESGVTVTDPEYLASQPWPFPASLMLGFTARAVTTELVPDGLEISALRWFSREELEREVRTGSITIPGPVSISRAIIEHWFGSSLEEASKHGAKLLIENAS